MAGTLGLPEAATYFVASARLETRAALVRVTILSAGIGAVLALLVMLVAPLISSGEPEVTSLMIYGAWSLPPVLVVGALRGVAAGRNRWGLVNTEKYISNGLRLALVLVFAVCQVLTLSTAVIVYLGCPVVAGVVYLPFLRSLRGGPKQPRQKGAGLLLLRFGSSTWVGGLSGVLLARMDLVLMAPLAGARQLGLYAAAVAVGEIPYVVTGATRDVILAVDAAEADDQRAERAARLTLLVTTLLASVLAALAPLVVLIAFGSDFEGSIGMLQLLLLAAVLFTPGSTAGAILLARGRPGVQSFSLTIACAVNMGLVLLLVPQYGGMGAAWASVIGYAVLSVSNLVFARRLLKLSPRAMLVPTLADLRRTDWMTPKR